MDSLDDLLAEFRRKRAERTASIGDVSNGAILTCESGQRWVFLLPDMTEPGKWRMQRFDERGFSGHSIFNTQDELVSAAADDGFFRHDPGALDRLQGTSLFQRGNFLTDLVQRINARELSHAEADRLLAEYDAQPA
ncbi:hypothetical protein [Methylibium petroleiphilum]|uniref:Uncharacterized protein n=1 Tax=Methylibium petroleiphilum (strain ATCC BAA-1232 / LMG 22953 / PM1) TaxID=420662 RepID=A2SNH0_METPP|nr:hypothetical protein [Methylibium petroleiphilum]ABM97109.1 hypothetical protein Mpe_B0334 [Methylibium petroleiphilum PM1]